MTTAPPASPLPFGGAALSEAAKDDDDGVDAPLASSMSAASFQGPTMKLEQKEVTPESADGFLDEWNAENVVKLKKYQSSYARRLKAKYFSKKALNGEDIFNHETRVDNVAIKSSRWPCTRSFTDPIQNFEDQNKFPSSTVAEPPI